LRARGIEVPRGQGRLAQLAAIMRRHRRTLALLVRRQLAPQVERRAPLALLLVHPGEPLQHRRPITLRTHEAAQLFLGAIHEARAQVVETQRKCGLLANGRFAVLRELGVNGDGPIHFAAAAHETAERELDVGFVRFVGEAREHFGGAVVPVVDQVIEAREIVHVAAHAAAARGTPAQCEGGRADHQETQQENFRTDAAQAHGVSRSSRPTLNAAGEAA
jgi:hypothetical protein